MRVIKDYLPESKFYRRGENKVKRIVIHALDHERTDGWLIAYENKASNFYDAIVGTYGDLYLRNPDPIRLASRNVAHNNLWSYGICVNMPTRAKGIKSDAFLPIEQWTRIRDDQLVTLATHVREMCSQFGLDEIVCDLPHFLDSPIERRYARQSALAPYTVLGHYHHQRNRTDPNPHTMGYLRDALTIRPPEAEPEPIPSGTLAIPEAFEDNVKLVKSKSEAMRLNFVGIPAIAAKDMPWYAQACKKLSGWFK